MGGFAHKSVDHGLEAELPMALGGGWYGWPLLFPHTIMGLSRPEVLQISSKEKS